VKTQPSPGAPLLFAFLLLAAAAAFAWPAAAETRYVCPPCASSCDTMTFTAPGVCPACGMTLVEVSAAAATPAADPAVKKVAILVFNGVEIVDSMGPYEMFGAAGCDVYTVAATKDPVTSAMGLTVVPKYSFAEAPQPDVLVVPGGGVYGAAHSEPTLAYVRGVTARATHTMSVCNGAFILAAAGLLDGLSATTTYHNIPKLASQYPNIKVVEDQRYVDNGKIITTAGLSAGMDGAFHVIGKLFGIGYAQSVALSEEYDWKPDAGFARAALADHQIPQIKLDDWGKWDMVRTEGDTRHWDLVVKGTTNLAATELVSHVEEALASGKWTKVSASSPSPGSHTSTWRFTGTDGKPWKATLKLENLAGEGRPCTAALAIARAG
jgi:putative intracellular protease/amidase